MISTVLVQYIPAALLRWLWRGSWFLQPVEESDQTHCWMSALVVMGDSFLRRYCGLRSIKLFCVMLFPSIYLPGIALSQFWIDLSLVCCSLAAGSAFWITSAH